MPFPIMLVWIVVGVVIGVLSGFMGVGGGIVLTPILLYLGFKPSVASATSLAFIIPVGLASIIRSKHDVDFPRAGVIALGAVVGAFMIGRPLVEKFNDTQSAYLNPSMYKKVFGIIMLLVALDMVGGFSDRLRERARQTQPAQVTRTQ